SGASWATNAIRWSAPGDPAGMPSSTVTAPSVGLARPTDKGSLVVLPPPFGPTRATMGPPGMVSVQSRSAHLRRYRLPRLLVSMTFMSGYGRCAAIAVDIGLSGVHWVYVGTPLVRCLATLCTRVGGGQTDQVNGRRR